MIRFQCQHCGTKYELKEEFAGRQTRCRTCREPLTVPTVIAPVAVPVSIEGPRSSLQQLGLSGGLTLTDSPPTCAPADSLGPTVAALGVGVSEALQQAGRSGQRYQVAGELGRGGMGLVLRAIDCDIRREVAVKYLLDPTNPHKQARFVEEAQITGQLEHPNIAPVHDLGVDTQQRLFFTMKMVRGRSLAQVLDQLRKEPRSAAREWSLGRLLTVLVNVCHALSYAHARGVIHRDLKPANIMLGDFGEVYVMDWGLAKVLQSGAPVAKVAPAQDATLPAPSAHSVALSDRVVTSRTQEQADLTQDGAVLGTPLYMPPEQAEGKIHAIDQRSDVYALGAILYEVLTLSPPVDKEGGFLSVMHRVISGAIAPPEQRKPGVPRELAAVAMKALSREPAQRYPNVEAFRTDIERYQEGRSVSARPDTFREASWKLVKRNRGISAGLAIALLVLLGSLGFLMVAWAETRSAYGAFRTAQGEKDARTRQAVPALLEAADLAIQQGRMDNALAQVNVALEYDPEHTAARLLKGQLLVSRRQFADAAQELNRYLQQRPEDTNAARLAHLCVGDTSLASTLADIGNLLVLQKQPTLAVGFFQDNAKRLEVYRNQINRAWPGVGRALCLDADFKFTLELSQVYKETFVDLTPLRGIPLSSLRLINKPTRDLTPLQGMPLVSLELQHLANLTDLAPLRDLPLKTLKILECPRVDSLTPLKGLALTRLHLECRYGNPSLSNLGPLAEMPLEEVKLLGLPIRDLTPLSGMPLHTLSINCRTIVDLTPLKGLSLKALNVAASGVADLGPLRGMQLERLAIWETYVSDLSPLSGMPLRELLANSQVLTDLRPLQGMPLKTLTINSLDTGE